MYQDIEFCCTEQIFMWRKAMYFKDKNTARKILNSRSPSEMKKLGRQIKNYNDEKWKAVSYQIMREANIAKFEQNLELKNLLKSTKGKILVEASPWDSYWGIGISENDPRLKDPSKWGKNYLGKILMQIRDEILHILK